MSVMEANILQFVHMGVFHQGNGLKLRPKFMKCTMNINRLYPAGYMYFLLYRYQS